VLLTNYTGSTGFGEAFAQAIQGDPLRGPGRGDQPGRRRGDRALRFIDGERQCAGGASYGGHLANWLQSSTDRYRCLISHAGLVNLESQWGTSDVAFSREANIGGPPWEIADGLGRAEPDPLRGQLAHADAGHDRQARLPGAAEQRARVLDGAAAPAGREPAAGLPEREPLDPERPQQPPLLRRDRRVAGRWLLDEEAGHCRGQTPLSPGLSSAEGGGQYPSDARRLKGLASSICTVPMLRSRKAPSQ
jgi:hypothetical protein